MPQSNWYEFKQDAITIAVKVIPNAKKSAWLDDYVDGYRKIRISTPAVEGAANRALLSFFAKALSVKKWQLKIIQGEKARLKVIQIEGLSRDAFLNKFD